MSIWPISNVALDTIARDRPKLLIEIEERHNADRLARIRERLASLGYTGYFFLDGQWLPPRIVRNWRHSSPSDSLF